MSNSLFSEDSTWCSQEENLYHGKTPFPLRRSQRLLQLRNAEISSTQMQQHAIDDSSKNEASAEHLSHQWDQTVSKELPLNCHTSNKNISLTVVQETALNSISEEQKSNPLDLRTRPEISKPTIGNSSCMDRSNKFIFQQAPTTNLNLEKQITVRPKPPIAPRHRRNLLRREDADENNRPLAISDDLTGARAKKRRMAIQIPSRQAPPPKPVAQRAQKRAQQSTKASNKRQQPLTPQSCDNPNRTLSELAQVPRASQLNAWQYVNNAAATTSMLPAIYPPHFTEQRSDVVVNFAGALGFVPIIANVDSHLPHINMPAIQRETYLTPDLTQTFEFGPSSTSSSPSLGSLHEFFETEDLRTLLNVDRIAYRLTERHVEALAVVLNLSVLYLRQVLDKILTLSPETLQVLNKAIKKLPEEQVSPPETDSMPSSTALAPPSPSEQIECTLNEAVRKRRHFASHQHMN